MENLEKILEKIKKMEKFKTYFNELVFFNEKVNLTAITEKEEVYIKHFLDSVLAIDEIEKGASVIDVGTGAGFPGLPLKIMREDINLTLVDSLNKRVEFIKILSKRLGYKINENEENSLESLETDCKNKNANYLSGKLIKSGNTKNEKDDKFLKILENKNDKIHCKNSFNDNKHSLINDNKNTCKTFLTNDENYSEIDGKLKNNCKNSLNNSKNNKNLSKNLLKNINFNKNLLKNINFNKNCPIKTKNNILIKNNIAQSKNQIGETDFNNANIIKIFHSRAEDFCKNARESYDVAVARAVARLNTLLEYFLPLVKIGGIVLAYKGTSAEEELVEAKNAIKILGGKYLKTLHFTLPNNMGERNIIVIQKIKPSPKTYPRSQNKPKTNPL